MFLYTKLMLGIMIDQGTPWDIKAELNRLIQTPGG